MYALPQRLRKARKTKDLRHNQHYTIQHAKHAAAHTPTQVSAAAILMPLKYCLNSP